MQIAPRTLSTVTQLSRAGGPSIWFRNRIDFFSSSGAATCRKLARQFARELRAKQEGERGLSLGRAASRSVCRCEFKFRARRYRTGRSAVGRRSRRHRNAQNRVVLVVSLVCAQEFFKPIDCAGRRFETVSCLQFAQTEAPRRKQTKQALRQVKYCARQNHAADTQSISGRFAATLPFPTR